MAGPFLGRLLGRRQAQDPAAAPILGEVLIRHRAEGSVLDRAAELGLAPYHVGGRPRLATCGGVAWYGSDRLAVVNLYGSHLRIYRVETPGKGMPARLELLHEVRETIHYPEHVAAAPDGSLLAVTHSQSAAHGLSLHAVDPETGLLGPATKMLRFGTDFHGVAIAPDARHVAVTESGDPGTVEVIDPSSGRRTSLIENRFPEFKAKGLSFSRDGRLLVIVSARLASLDGKGAHGGGLLAVHRYRPDEGVVDPRPLAMLRDKGRYLGAADSCAVAPVRIDGRYRILCADQAGDRLTAFDFDENARRLRPVGLATPGLSFPHAVAFSDDGRHVAIANYGDDTLVIAATRGFGRTRAADGASRISA